MNDRCQPPVARRPVGLCFSPWWPAGHVGPVRTTSPGRSRTKRAERGAAEVTIRDIASAAGVSPSLVIHYYGSKNGLKEAVEVRATALVEAFVSELVDPSRGGAPATSLAGVFADRLEQEPILASYVQRLLVDGGPGAESLFRSLFDATLGGLESWRPCTSFVRPLRIVSARPSSWSTTWRSFSSAISFVRLLVLIR